jgi:hypothetical protein
MQRLLGWTPSLVTRALEMVQTSSRAAGHWEDLSLTLGPHGAEGPPWVAVHLRIGRDFRSFCSRKPFADNFAAAVAAGRVREGSVLERSFETRSCFLGSRKPSLDACLPSRATVVDAVQRAVDESGACVVFVGSDVPLRGNDRSPGVESVLTASDLRPPPGRGCGAKGVSLVVQPGNERLGRGAAGPADPLLDAAAMSLAPVWIGSCISSFSAFVSRQREMLWQRPASATRHWGVIEERGARGEEL